ncbi:MAG: hypothetical protein PHV47_00450 [Candidatus Pacebacteria bacterium]|nr:hypothetical protein [Candidatus Paceibacterota bacterium]
MKKILISLLLCAVILTAFGGIAFAAKKAVTNPRNAGLGFEIMLKAKADVLGISVSDLETALNSGKKFIDVATENGLTKEQVCQNIKTQLQTKVSAMVAANILTQAQADRWKTWMDGKQSGNGDCLYQGFFGVKAMGKGLGRYYNWK